MTTFDKYLVAMACLVVPVVGYQLLVTEQGNLPFAFGVVAVISAVAVVASALSRTLRDRDPDK